jgi:hypothetical protein
MQEIYISAYHSFIWARDLLRNTPFRRQVNIKNIITLKLTKNNKTFVIGTQKERIRLNFSRTFSSLLTSIQYK